MKVGYWLDDDTVECWAVKDKLRHYGCDAFFYDKKESRAGRSQLDAALDAARAGDVLVVVRLEHLAQSLYQLAQVVRWLDQRQVRLVVLDQGLDSSQSGMYQTVLAVAEFDRDLVNHRIADGVAKAKAAGVKFGRQKKLSAAEINMLRQECREPGANRAELAKKYGISRSSLYRLMQKFE